MRERVAVGALLVVTACSPRTIDSVATAPTDSAAATRSPDLSSETRCDPPTRTGREFHHAFDPELDGGDGPADITMTVGDVLTVTEKAPEGSANARQPDLDEETRSIPSGSPLRNNAVLCRFSPDEPPAPAVSSRFFAVAPGSDLVQSGCGHWVGSSPMVLSDSTPSPTPPMPTPTQKAVCDQGNARTLYVGVIVEPRSRDSFANNSLESPGPAECVEPEGAEVVDLAVTKPTSHPGGDEFPEEVSLKVGQVLSVSVPSHPESASAAAKDVGGGDIDQLASAEPDFLCRTSPPSHPSAQMTTRFLARSSPGHAPRSISVLTQTRDGTLGFRVQATIEP